MKRTFLVLLISVLFSVNIFSKVPADDKELAAFKLSYQLEAKSEFAKAIAVLKDVYREDSHEIHLRLGWVSYEAGLFTQSMTYYQNATNHRPDSVEAKLGFVFPSAALGNWDQVITQYNKILEIDAQNSTVNYRIGLIYYGPKN